MENKIVLDQDGVKVGKSTGIVDGKLVVRTGFWIFGSTYHIPVSKYTINSDGSVRLTMRKQVLEVGAYIERK